MIAYVESNFVLELALLQEENAACEGVLQLAEAREIIIAIPSFSLGEPYETLIRRHQERRLLALKFTTELDQLRRSEPYAATAKNSDALISLLSKSGKEEAERLNRILSRLVEIATILPTDRDVMRTALSAQQALDLSPQDSIVYASVRQHVTLGKRQQCFINKNVKDFLIPQIEDNFATYECKLLGKFTAGLAYINAMLTQTRPSSPAPAAED